MDYKKKLELVQFLRNENQINHSKLNERESILYGKTTPINRLQSRKIGGRNENNMDYSNYSVDQSAEDNVVDEQSGKAPSILCLKNRMILAVLLFAILFSLKHTNSINGFSNYFNQAKEYVAIDFSKEIVDYITNFTYTLDYEKTSIK